MKTASFLAIILSIFSFETFGQASVVEIPATTVYIPTGLDNNDIAQFVVQADFPPNGCYRMKEVKIESSLPAILGERKIKFRVLAYKFQGQCEEYSKEVLVDVGLLPMGKYEVAQLKERSMDIDKSFGDLNIGLPSSYQRDNFIYAAVDHLKVEVKQQLTSTDQIDRFLVVQLHLTSSCHKIPTSEEYKTTPNVPKNVINKTETNLIEVLPWLKRDTSAQCKKIDTETEVKYPIPSDIPEGKYLFHVRTLDGSSYNKVATVPKSKITPRNVPPLPANNQQWFFNPNNKLQGTL